MSRRPPRQVWGLAAVVALAGCTSVYSVSAAQVLRAREAVASGNPREPIRATRGSHRVYLPAERAVENSVTSPFDAAARVELPDPRVGLYTWGYAVLGATAISTAVLSARDTADGELMAALVGLPVSVGLALVFAGHFADGPNEIEAPSERDTRLPYGR